jgi:hypothetical protein
MEPTMNRAAFCLACAAVLCGTDTLRAQPMPPPVPGGGGFNRPTFSPYLNLARPGGSPALNYFGLVRPEFQFRQSIQNLQGAVAANQQAIGTVESELTGMPATGHTTQFLNLGGHFLNSGPSLASTRPGGAIAPRPVAPLLPNGGTGMVSPPRRR